MKASFLLALTLVAALNFGEVIGQKKVVCYYGSWAVYRPGNGKFSVEDINPSICTHLIYSFVGLGSDNKVKVLDSWNDEPDDYGKNAMGRFTGLKKKNANLKTLVAIGGWNEGSEKYSKMVASADSRRTFVDSVIPLLKKYNFDGFDVDWEYPTQRGGAPADKANFILLLKDLKEEFKKYGYLLSAAVSAGANTIEPSYDVPAMSEYLDFINVMAYDFHGAWEQKTHHNTPLYATSKDQGDNAKLNVDYAINLWIKKGAPAEKLILGLATYGRGWTLDNQNERGIYAPASQPIPAGPYTRENGYWGYNEICEKFKSEKWTIVRDASLAAPYAYKEKHWIGYEDASSIQTKAKYAKSKGLGGVMTWSLETDDFRGVCGSQDFPLIRTMKQVMNGGNVDPMTTTEDPNTDDPDETTEMTTTTRRSWRRTTTKTTTTSEPPPSGKCTKEGYFRDRNDCQKFYRCVSNGNNGYTKYNYRCDDGTVFNERNTSCDWPRNVPECDK